jgi:hypothetical protein
VLTGRGDKNEVSVPEPEQAVIDARDLSQIEDCLSLLLAERGGDNLESLAQLLSLTSIVEREYAKICAKRQR